MHEETKNSPTAEYKQMRSCLSNMYAPDQRFIRYTNLRMYPSDGSQHNVSVLVLERWEGAAVEAEGAAAEAVIARGEK